MRLNQVEENGRHKPWPIGVNPAHVIYAEPATYFVDPHPGPSSNTKRKTAKGTRLYLLRMTIVVEEKFDDVLAGLFLEGE